MAAVALLTIQAPRTLGGTPVPECMVFASHASYEQQKKLDPRLQQLAARPGSRLVNLMGVMMRPEIAEVA